MPEANRGARNAARHQECSRENWLTDYEGGDSMTAAMRWNEVQLPCDTACRDDQAAAVRQRRSAQAQHECLELARTD